MANHFGKPMAAYLGSEFTVRQTGDGSFEATDSYTAPWSTVQTFLTTLLGSNHTRSGWEFLRVESWEVEPNRSDLCKIVVNLSSNSNEGDDFDFEQAADDDFTYELAITTSEDPLETHYRYRNVSVEEKDLITFVRLGSFVRVLTEDPEIFQFKNTTDEDDIREVKSAGGIELVKYILANVVSYQRARQIWRVKWVDDKLPQAKLLNLVGHIAKAPGLPTLEADRNTLLNGLNCSQSGKTFANVAEYEISGRGGFDPKIYKKDEPDPT